MEPLTTGAIRHMSRTIQSIMLQFWGVIGCWCWLIGVVPVNAAAQSSMNKDHHNLRDFVRDLAEVKQGETFR